MKALGTGMMVLSGAVLGMAAGAYLVMNNHNARKIYRCGKPLFITVVKDVIKRGFAPT